MKKIIEFLQKPFITTLLAAIGLTGGFLIGITANKLVSLQNIQNEKNKACKDVLETMCVQVHACTDSTVEECDKLVAEQDLCKTNLPDLQVIFQCKDDLRHIECDEELPVSCSLFME